MPTTLPAPSAALRPRRKLRHTLAALALALASHQLARASLACGAAAARLLG